MKEKAQNWFLCVFGEEHIDLSMDFGAKTKH
jgi:hypothetical protein